MRLKIPEYLAKTISGVTALYLHVVNFPQYMQTNKKTFFFLCYAGGGNSAVFIIIWTVRIRWNAIGKPSEAHFRADRAGASDRWSCCATAIKNWHPFRWWFRKKRLSPSLKNKPPLFPSPSFLPGIFSGTGWDASRRHKRRNVIKWI